MSKTREEQKMTSREESTKRCLKVEVTVHPHQVSDRAHHAAGERFVAPRKVSKPRVLHRPEWHLADCRVHDFFGEEQMRNVTPTEGKSVLAR